MAVLSLTIPDAQIPRVEAVARRITGDQTSAAGVVVKNWLIAHIKSVVAASEAAAAAQIAHEDAAAPVNNVTVT